MAAASNETISTQVSSPSTIFNDYLNRREETLSLYHPQWDLTNDEISSSSDLLKRDGTPVCIPPSWDLVQKYAGALDNLADGYDKDLYAKGSRYFSGDQGEAEFHHVMRNLKIGGVLIGDIKSQHLLYGSELPEEKKEKFMLPNCSCQIIVKIRKKLALENRNDRRKTDEGKFIFFVYVVNVKLACKFSFYSQKISNWISFILIRYLESCISK
jgi:hypothetical protein